MEILYTDGSDRRFIALCEELDGFLNEAVGGEKQRSKYSQYNSLEKIHDVVLIVEDGTAVACGGLREYEPGTAEIKRVFTRAACRGCGYGGHVMAALEKRAREKGYTRLILETGAVLQSAARLYRALGYRVIENYGPYASMPESVCMEKILALRSVSTPSDRRPSF